MIADRLLPQERMQSMNLGEKMLRLFTAFLLVLVLLPVALFIQWLRNLKVVRNYYWRKTAPRRKLYKWIRRHAQARAVEERLIAKDQWRIYKQFRKNLYKHPAWEWSSMDGNRKWDMQNIQWQQTMLDHRRSAIEARYHAMTVNCKRNQEMAWVMAGTSYGLAVAKELGGYDEKS